MAAPIQNPAKCEVRSVIRFLHGKGQRPADIHKEIVSVYGNIMNRQNVTKWCHHFSEGRTDVHDEQWTGRPSVISDVLLQRTEETIRALGHHLDGKSFHDDDEIKDVEICVCGSDNRRQPSMTVGYKSLCADFTNVWITGMIMPKNNK
ncbi:uncharacterized protein TNCV_1136211 [Trichonephila clavipes]|nr:uncharacterized protein TNCV_1136211 [Trichonephila clavipes]